MKLRYGIIGTGMIAEHQARALGDVEDAEVTAVLSRSSLRARDFAEKFDCRACTEMSEFLTEVDAVSICTPAGLHLESALPALEAGKHLMVEKPLEISLKRGMQIVEAAEKKNLKLGGIFQSRFYESSRVIKNALEEERFGRLIMGDAYVKWFRSQEYYDRTDWKGTFEYDGGGTLMNQAIHAVDLLQWFMGQVRTVQARCSILGHSGIEVEDTAAAVLEFDNSALGVIEGSTAVYPGFLKRIEISGTQGTAVLEEEELKTWSFESERPEDPEIRERCGVQSGSGGGASDPGAISTLGHRLQFEDFTRAVLEDGEPFIGGIESLKSVAIIEAIYASGKSGRMVPVERL
ncbi:Gfo/Idh/MocA family oxidoreductase [Marispirochaeta aestuarii]|uniref:Gfo/Idh/MocA family protein n=1 Tax=Marispirochaeta aestuarii TaxID=1963862 RepID=UPI0029C7D58A|nr:Gfo/Idh/MocA family oxidoreductase [Marispirochaeta aestuarii]